MRPPAVRGALAAAILLVALAALAASGCTGDAGPSAAERARLDSLDATGVVRAYFGSGSQAIELHLSPPEERDRRAQPNYVGDSERAGGISDLVIEGGDAADWSIAGADGYADLRLFTVAYTSSRTNSIGQPPGGRYFFVYVGRSPGGGPWRVVGVGTGP